MTAQRLLKFMACLAQRPLWTLSALVPRRPDLWVFGAWRGRAYSDNPKYLYEHVRRHRPAIQAVWITRSRALCASLRGASVNAHFHLSPAGLYYQLRAGAVFFTHTLEGDFLGAAVGRGAYTCQLWHGTPLKRILWDDPEHKASEESAFRRAATRLFPWLRNRWSLVVAPSRPVARLLAGAFRETPVAVTGYPRTDGIVAGTVSATPRPIRRAIYMPTFRGSACTAGSDEAIDALFEAAGFDVERLDATCDRLGLELVIRLHPSNRPKAALRERIDRARRIRFDTEADFYAAINAYDALITDYSSVFYDFLLTGKPVIHAGFDARHYMQDARSLYRPYDEICLTPGLADWAGVMAILERFAREGPGAEYVQRYRRLAEWANARFDAPCSENVARYVEARLARRAAS